MFMLCALWVWKCAPCSLEEAPLTPASSGGLWISLPLQIWKNTDFVSDSWLPLGEGSTSKQLFLQTFKTSLLFLPAFPLRLCFWKHSTHPVFEAQQYSSPSKDHITAMIYGSWIIRSLGDGLGLRSKEPCVKAKGGVAGAGRRVVVFVCNLNQREASLCLIGKRLSVWRNPWKESLF